jgi:hypothetical protein
LYSSGNGDILRFSVWVRLVFVGKVHTRL